MRLARLHLPALLVAVLSLPGGCESSPVTKGAPPDAGASVHNEAPSAPAIVVVPTQSAEPRFVGAAQVLVTWKGADGAPATVTRPKADARKRVEAALEALRSQKRTFEEVLAEYSDDPAAKATGGAIGNFERYAMPRAFADAAFALDVGAVSSVVETAKGFHLIKRLR